jgi:hypothetical protein
MAGTHDAMEFRAANLCREILTKLLGHHDVVASVNHKCRQRNRLCALCTIETIKGLLLASEAFDGPRGMAP